MMLKEDQTIYLVPMAKKKFAQFTFMPDNVMSALLDDFNIPYETGKEPFRGKKLIKADKTDAVRYIIPLGEKKRLYHFYFMSNIIEKVFDYYKVPYFKNVEVSQVIADLKLDIREINLHKIKSKKKNKEKETNKDMLNYAQKQRKSGLESWYICKELGLRADMWTDIRMGRRSLTGEKLDRFIQMTDPKRNELLVQQSEARKVEEWVRDVVLHKINIDELFKDFNVSRADAAKDIGYDDSTLNKAINGKKSPALYYLYYFFQDESNRRNKSGKRKYKKRKNTVEVTPEIKEEETATIDEIITEEEPKVETVAQESDTKKESDFEIDDAFKEYAKKVEEDNKELEKVVEKQEAVLCALRASDHTIESLKRANDELQRELNRYKYLIDLAMTKENTL